MRFGMCLFSVALSPFAAGCGGDSEPTGASTNTGATGTAGATTTMATGAATATDTTAPTGNMTTNTPDSATQTTGTAGAQMAGAGAVSTGNGGAGNVGGGATASDAAADTATADGSCSITSNAIISEAIATVGIVTFSTDMASVDAARIEFGLDTNYGLTAPADLQEPEYRTLLLGMKQNNEYHYRIVVSSGGQECAGADQTIETGPLPNSLPSLQVMNIDREALTGGFLITGQYQARGGDTSPAYIIDADGDYVWALEVGDYVTGVRQSYDGKYMWINGTDNTAGGAANIHRVTMDGLIDEDLSEEFGIQDHSITVLPDESVIFYGHDGDCADIKRRYPDGTIEPLVNSQDAHGATGMCHVNHIEYSPEDETLIFSDDYHDNYTKITLDGEVVWVLGGDTNMFTGDGSTWERQHGLDVLGVNRFVYFNNGAMTAETGSRAHEVVLDTNEMTATRVWTYVPDPPIANPQLGDVQRMENGNTVIAFSVQGVVHEVDSDGNLLQEIVWPIGGAFGYINKRLSLYGPAPR